MEKVVVYPQCSALTPAEEGGPLPLAARWPHEVGIMNVVL